MKYRGNRKYLYFGVTGLTIVCGGILFYYILFHGSNISGFFKDFINVCRPFLVGFIIAYLITPIINTIENRLFIPLYRKFKKDKENSLVLTRKTRKVFRVFSVILAYLIIAVFIYGILILIIPELQKSIGSIVVTVVPNAFRKYYNLALDYINSNESLSAILNNVFSFDIKSINLQQVISIAGDQLQNLGSLIASLSLGIVSALKATLNVLIGLIVSFYLVYDKEKFAAQAKKIVYAFFERPNANRLIKDCRFVHKTFIGFISGKIVDSIIIGLLCFICMTILQIHYPMLISVIVGITNIIPFFGPWLGAIPSILLLLMINPFEALKFTIFVLVLQQVDGNIIGPKILGSSTGITGFWVIFAITFFGSVGGILGMFVGVPVFAVIYAFIKRFVDRRLENKEMASSTEDYINLYQMGDDNEVIEKEHLYTEIRNPKGIKRNENDDKGSYHFSITKKFDSLFHNGKVYKKIKSGKVDKTGSNDNTNTDTSKYISKHIDEKK